VPGRFEFAEHRVGVPDEEPPGIRRHHTVCLPLEQRPAGGAFHQRDLTRDRRLCVVEALRRLGERTAPCGLAHHPQADDREPARSLTLAHANS